MSPAEQIDENAGNCRKRKRCHDVIIRKRFARGIGYLAKANRPLSFRKSSPNGAEKGCKNALL